MCINYRKVLVAGPVAGIALIVINVLAQIIFGNRLQQDMDAWIPGSSERVGMSGASIAVGLLLKLIIGTMLVWFYAAVQPRFGPGLRTAFYTGVFSWILGAIFFTDYLMIGMMSATTYVVIEVIQLLSFLFATALGARIYSEKPVPIVGGVPQDAGK